MVRSITLKVGDVMPEEESHEEGIPKRLKEINNTIHEIKRLLEMLLEKTSS